MNSSSNASSHRVSVPQIACCMAVLAFTSHGIAAPGQTIDVSASGVLHQVLTDRAIAGTRLLGVPAQAQFTLWLAFWSALLLALYGGCMGFAGGFRQSIASALKTPLVFLLSLAVCFPVLHVVATLADLKLTLLSSVSLAMVAVTLNALLLACFAPLVLFFGISSDYDFMKLLHVAVFSVCGVFSSVILQQELRGASMQQGLPAAQGGTMFMLWIATYGFVGLQMAWTLRPLIGEPHLPFQWLRRRSKGVSVYSAIWVSMSRLGRNSASETSQSRATGCGIEPHREALVQ
jgi:hypothetical protein